MSISDLRFLVVEDHEFQRRLLLTMLAGLGAVHLAVAGDGHAALQVIREPDAAIDIIISDLDMPGMDGMEFMRHLGEAGLPVSVILASALDSALLASVETMTMAYGLRILGVIQKPITPPKLEALIQRHRKALPSPAPVKPDGPSFVLEEIVEGLQNNQFEPFFQPKVELANGRVKGAEALARWRHPRLGIVGPYAFIDLLEAEGLIDELTWIMLKKSAAFCSLWRRESGLEVTVSVNLSIKSLVDVQLAERVTDIVRQENLEPRSMVLEVTESATTTDIGKVLENLSRLRMKGFGLSIDDYGTGYSSMQQLTRIPFTELKLDQSFVANAVRQHSARVILESSLDMARRLNIVSVAEGVETAEDWHLLRDLGYQLAQGYYIAKPLDADSFLEWSRNRTQVSECAG